MKRSPLGPGAKSIERGSTFRASKENGREGMRSTALRRNKAGVPILPPRPVAQKPAEFTYWPPGKPYPRSLRRRARRLALAWAAWARRSPCAMCGSREDLSGHHVLEKQWLKARYRSAGYELARRIEVLWDTRNCLTLCWICHDRHHSHAARVPRKIVLEHCPGIVAFAAQHDLVTRFDRTYPLQPT